MRLSEKGIESNIDYWKNVADRYRRQRDDALREVKRLQEVLLTQTGKAYDGMDYIREIQASRTTATWRHRLKSFFGRFK